MKGKRKGIREVRVWLPDLPGPRKQGQVDDHQDQDAWIARNAARARQALANAAVRAELLSLLDSHHGGQRRERRLEEARLELAGLEARWPSLEEGRAWTLM